MDGRDPNKLPPVLNYAPPEPPPPPRDGPSIFAALDWFWDLTSIVDLFQLLFVVARGVFHAVLTLLSLLADGL